MKRVKKIISTYLLCLFFQAAIAQQPVINAIRQSIPVAYLSDGSVASTVKIARKWKADFCAVSLTNTGKKPVRIKEVVILQASRIFNGSTSFYGEGFQMLSQYKGTLAAPENVGSYDDHKHYNLPEPAGYKVVYNMLLLHSGVSLETLMGFNSSFRFIGKFYLSADTIKVVMDIDNITLAAGASINLEEFSLMQGTGVNELTEKFAARINHFHPRRKKSIPAGWCSWYCFGPDVTEKNITDNLTAIKQDISRLKYIQLDDGYQLHMGDWLETASSFGSDIKGLLQKIKANGFEPAIWVAPFICDSNSNIFKQHPDWLVKDSAGGPLRSDRVSFGGWRLNPWYVLDGTNPAVQQHLKNVFSTMYKEWGCTYFKLDANYWGAIRGGFYYDKNATRITAYRSGMQAILNATGDAFILGCNHPLWPSLGLIDGSRSSNDIERSWYSFKKTGEENIRRMWQNGKLWWNDPDCILLTGDLTDDEFRYHASLLFATGGLMLSGDDLASISEERLNMLKKMLPPTGAVTTFNSALDIGWMKTETGTWLVLLNKEDTAKHFTVPLSEPYTFTNFWTGEIAGTFNHQFNAGILPPHSGFVYHAQIPVKSR
jgi:alpha-galactosidase